MLKYLVSTALCAFAFLSACEPNSNELLDPASSEPPKTTIDPIEQPTPIETDSSIILALAEVNAWREKGCECGAQTMPVVSKVTWNTKLYNAALAHAKDMQAKSYFSHTSQTGENVYHRLTSSGYASTATDMLAYGENIAFGNFDIAAVVRKWLASPSHCANIMRESYKEMAIAYDGKYWVQVFGAKRN